MKYPDAAMLEFLGEYYARDRQHVYFRRKLVRDADPASFSRWATAGQPIATHLSERVDEWG
jgi:DKNYY family